MQFISVMENRISRYQPSLQCHTILQKSFWYAEYQHEKCWK